MGSHHDHSHENDTYFLDQLCLVGLSGAFAAICLGMFFWNTTMLKRLLAPDFFPYVLSAGIALAVLVVLRSLVLWGKAAQMKTVAHSHDHHHDHGHDHAHDHDHAHGECCGHDHANDHGQTHTHDHGHDHSHDHDHGWAPWRYAVLLIPIMLFLLGLPDRDKQLHGGTVKIDLAKESPEVEFATVVALGNHPLNQASAVVAALGDSTSGQSVIGIGFKELEALGLKADQRAKWKGKSVQVVGQFAPVGSDRIFSLARSRIQCCGADAIQLNVPAICREKLPDMKRGDWVKVTGTVDFREIPGGRGFTTILQIPRANLVQKTDPDPDPYIQ